MTAPTRPVPPMTALTETERRVLETCEAMPERGWDGWGPHGAGQEAVAADLLRSGLIGFVGIGACGECDGDNCPGPDGGPIYAITDAGRAALEGK